ncbi:MAG: septation protein SpoVG family protein [Candidatus Nanoarchaeia archaeon]|jgi:stage V sporulation protein G|nr:septation protein SpoVG family protein [Candidatus Nanoarchaeia archaeon]
MEITEVRVTISDDKKVRAYVSITLDDILVVHGIKILDGKKGIFIAMPSKRVGDKFKDLVHPLNTDFRKNIQHRILSEFEKIKEDTCKTNY